VSPLAAEVLDALPLAVVLLDADARITGWNDAAHVLYGHDRDEVLGRAVLDVLFEEEDRGDASAALADVASGRPWEGDRRVRRRDGVLLVSSFRAVPLPDGAIAWIATDNMDQGLAEQEREVLLSAEHAARATAEEALGLVEAIVTSAPVGIAVFDLDLRYVRVNDAYATFSGVPPEEHVGGRVGEVVQLPPDAVADLRRVVTTGRTLLSRHVVLDQGHPARVRHLNVNYYPVRTTSGALVGAGVTVVDVTETKRAEAERAALLERAEAARQRLAILATASTVLSTTMDVDELLTRLARVLTPGAADWCVIQLLSSEGRTEHVAVSHRDRDLAVELMAFLRDHPVALDGAGPIADVVRGGHARLLRPDAATEALATAAADRGDPTMAARFDVRSSVVVPIEVRGDRIGVILLSTDGDRVLDDDDLDLAVEIAHRAALALGNARAFQQEHQIAESLQRAMLPAGVPHVAGLDIAVRYESATDGTSVGGDWYDVIAFGDGEVAVVVGDVVGHDIAASTAMGQLRSVLRAYACEERGSPSAALARVDRLFDVLGLTYATCILGEIADSASSFRWSSAGHPPPLLQRDGTVSFLQEGTGVLLGVTGGESTGEAAIDLLPGDVIVLYTDGLIERRDASLSDGLARLAAAMSSLGGRSADQICDGLLAAMLPEGATQDDDIAILVARVAPEIGERVVHRVELDPRPESASLARGFTATVLESGGWAHVVDTATLLVSELVTNAVRHGHPPCALTVTIAHDHVELAVEDGDPTPPVRREPDPTSEDGRGYVLVDALASSWGVRRRARGKAAWFTLR
jgi:PAS domain S-box-containing protein